ncbi:DNA polymerase II [Oceanimonas sp. GK1]|uniref:DNA polymerase II n=1 Tax=Oceanimonas sp. (strain GK1 / IBRC-M 10197) TaxID=511062 RepID=UPI00024952DD|nr:DNA polymerase II [Oceanimonas sp. GK1]AEY01445.1 DNA polymerase II [Oceanimonas sp. GK1]
MNPIQQGFVLTRHSRDRQGHIELHYWLCTPQGPARLTVRGERALLMVPLADRLHVEQALTGLEFEWREPGLQSFARQPLAVLYLNTMSEQQQVVQRLQAHGIEVLEHDFRPHERYLISRFIRGSAEFTGTVRPRQGFVQVDDARLRKGDWQPRFRVLSLDIECSGQGELYSIGLYGDGLARVLMIGAPEPAVTDIQWVADERALLQGLESELAAYDPDIIIGWNLVAFDLRLMLKRAALHGIRLRLGRGGEEAFLRERPHTEQVFVTLPGRVAIDGIDALKTACYAFDSFSLESVAQALLGRGKQTEDVANRLASIMHDFRVNKPKLAAYNLEDCRLVWDIFTHTRVLDFLRLRSQLTGLELDRIGGSVAAFVQVYLPHLHRAGFVAPNLPPGGGLASPGGYVMDSRPGLYRHVLVLDFKSLYPSIIRTFRIDPLGLVLGLEEEDAIPGYRGARFSRRHHFLPDIIAGLWRERDQAKREGDASRSQAIKILMNSFYGVLGSGGCRFYDTRLASSITLRGHHIMQHSARRIEAEGHEVIYGDTDSVFVLLNGEHDEGSASREGQRLAELITAHWREQLRTELNLESYLELQFESYFARFLMPTIRGREEGSKKRYAGLRVKHGESGLVFKGLETVRSDWTPLARAFQTELYRLVFNDEDPTGLVRDTLAQTLGGQRDEELVYRKRLRRPLAQYVKSQPPQVRAARLADEHNARLGRPLRYQRKGVIAYVITVNGPEPVEYRQSAIDYQHYVDKQLRPVADAILPFVGLTFEGITGQQLGLF